MSRPDTSCPDWLHLAALQDDEPDAWAAALEHLDSCEACFDDALAADPTVLFRSMPVPQMSAEDIASIQDAVHTMRRTEPLARREEPPRRRFGWRHLATAAAIMGAAVLSGGGWTDGLRFADNPPAAQVAEASAVESDIESVSNDELPEILDVPLVEDLDPSYGSVVQVMDSDMSLVLVLPNGDLS